MSLSQEQMLDVMALVDDELEGEERARVEKLVGADDEAAELFASMRAIGDGVRGAVDPRTIGANAPDQGGFDVRDVVMARLAPNDLDKARIKRTARTRMVVVGASLVALAAAVLLYVRHQQTVAQNRAKPAASSETVLASAVSTGVQVDFVDSETPASVFFVPAEGVSTKPGTKEPPPSVVVWIDDTPPPAPPKEEKAP